MLHGWMDVGASWQFVVDAMASDCHVIAPDWRGFGLTDGGGADNYWQPDYLPISMVCSTITQANARSTWSATAWAATSP